MQDDIKYKNQQLEICFRKILKLFSIFILYSKVIPKINFSNNTFSKRYPFNFKNSILYFLNNFLFIIRI